MEGWPTTDFTEFQRLKNKSEEEMEEVLGQALAILEKIRPGGYPHCLSTKEITATISYLCGHIVALVKVQRISNAVIESMIRTPFDAN